MWISEMAARSAREAESAVEAGRVSIGGASPAVYADGELRGLRVLAPGGYRWRPSVGDDVLVLKTPDGAAYVAGAEQGGTGANLENGEVCIVSGGGAELRLKNNGGIELRGPVRLVGRVDIEGSLYLNGVRMLPVSL